MGRFYTAIMEGTSISAAKTLIQVVAGTGHVLKCHKFFVSQQASETSEQLEVQVLRATGGTSTAESPVKWDPGDAAEAAAATTGYDFTVEPTAGDVIYRESFNILNGWIWIPEGDLIVEPDGGIAIELLNAPGAALTMTAGIIYEEWGN